MINNSDSYLNDASLSRGQHHNSRFPFLPNHPILAANQQFISSSPKTVLVCPSCHRISNPKAFSLLSAQSSQTSNISPFLSNRQPSPLIRQKNASSFHQSLVYLSPTQPRRLPFAGNVSSAQEFSHLPKRKTNLLFVCTAMRSPAAIK